MQRDVLSRTRVLGRLDQRTVGRARHEPVRIREPFTREIGCFAQDLDVVSQPPECLEERADAGDRDGRDRSGGRLRHGVGDQSIDVSGHRGWALIRA